MKFNYSERFILFVSDHTFGMGWVVLEDSLDGSPHSLLPLPVIRNLFVFSSGSYGYN